MQDSYVGDIGDYTKLALLRALACDDYRLGVGWYKMPNELEKKDGRHICYLGLDRDGQPFDADDAAAKWRRFDPPLYDALREIVARRARNIAELEPLLPTQTAFHDVPVPRHGREQWFDQMQHRLNGSNLAFVDPDNGIAPAGYKAGSAKSGKSITYNEVASLRFRVRSLIVYHHHTHFVGGHGKEIEAMGAALQKRDVGCIAAIRAKSFSPRVFFLLGFDQELWRRARAFADSWGEKLEFIPIDGPPDSLNLPPSSPYSERAEQSLMGFGQQVDAGKFDHIIFPNARSAKP